MFNILSSVASFLGVRRLTRVFLLIDGNVGFQNADQLAIEMLEEFGRPYTVSSFAIQCTMQLQSSLKKSKLCDLCFHLLELLYYITMLLVLCFITGDNDQNRQEYPTQDIEKCYGVHGALQENAMLLPTTLLNQVCFRPYLFRTYFK